MILYLPLTFEQILLTIIREILHMEHHDELDAKGLNCPLPILRAKKAVNKLESGQTLKIIATDPGSVKDFESFCNQTGHALLGSEANGGEFTFYIQKG